MTDDERLAFNLLQMLNFAVLRRRAPEQYEFFGQAPEFYNKIFPLMAGGPCTTPWKFSAMLEFFLGEAEKFFTGEKTGEITSGVWEETGLTKENTALKAVASKLGGEQVILISLQAEEYAERLNVMRIARRQLQENRQLSSSLTIYREKARIDGLTGVLNRTTFMELLHDEIRHSQLLSSPLTLLILDIDDFKKVNDTYGHLVGDGILKNIGATMTRTLRRNDIIARYGGEEFAVLIPFAPMSEGRQAAEKIRACLAAMVVPDHPRITVSIGCAEYQPGEPQEGFFKRTDDALYMAKKSGKNRVCCL